MKEYLTIILDQTDLITNFSKWEYDESTTFMFLPIIPNNEPQIFSTLRNGQTFHNYFKLTMANDKLVITFINSNQSYYLSFSEDGHSELYLTGDDPNLRKVIKRLVL